MRLFVALDMPDAIKRQLETVRAEIPGADWVKPSMYHMIYQLGGLHSSANVAILFYK